MRLIVRCYCGLNACVLLEAMCREEGSLAVPLIGISPFIKEFQRVGLSLSLSKEVVLHRILTFPVP